jgi:hypothetical protein
MTSKPNVALAMARRCKGRLGGGEQRMSAARVA